MNTNIKTAMITVGMLAALATSAAPASALPLPSKLNAGPDVSAKVDKVYYYRCGYYRCHRRYSYYRSYPYYGGYYYRPHIGIGLGGFGFY